ncbi:MAG: hypothetical protein JWP41_4702 [Ramlibacter sp.]|nr:hypothetical protein [Ramlibacter sp.]
MRTLGACCLLVACGLAACRDAKLPQAGAERSATATMGGYGPGPKTTAPAPLTDVHGQPIPAPPVPAQALAQTVRAADEAALAVWVQDGHATASFYARGFGWTAPQPLETIHGQASDPQLVSNGQGKAMAVWRHTVGNIQSLRFSHFDADAGWSLPDVLPGALPRADAAGVHDAPRLQMDAQGNVTAQWASGLTPGEVQTSRYIEGRGWSRALSERVASASPASPGRRGPSLLL